MKRGVDTLDVGANTGISELALPPSQSDGNVISPISAVEYAPSIDYFEPPVIPVQEFGAEAMRAFSVFDSMTWPDSVQDIGLPYVLTRSPHDHVRARYERVELYTKQFVKLAQVRRERNKVSEDLKADIYERSQHNIDESLINPIDIAYVDEILMQEYLDFVKKTWGSSATLGELADQRTVDGKYYLLIAGHSRHMATEELEEEHADDGTFPAVPMEAKVHTVSTVWDIIRVQIGENISSTPGKERSATAIVEAYYYGLGTEWANEEEFLQNSGIKGITEGIFAEAMNFAKLPDSIRSFVLAGPLQYVTGVELGMCVPLLREYFTAMHKGGLSDDQLTEMIKRELAIIADTIVEEKKNITTAQNYIVGQRATWREMIATYNGKKKDAFELEMVSVPDKTLDEQGRKLREVLRKLGKRRGQELVEMLELNAEVVGADVVDPYLVDAELATADAVAAIKKHRAKAGEAATKAAAFLKEQNLF